MTSTIKDYETLGVSSTLLGHNFNSWRNVDLRAVLWHYGISELLEYKVSKIDLMKSLELIIPYYGLSSSDNLFGAHDGRSLPDLKQPQLRLTISQLLQGRLPSKLRWISKIKQDVRPRPTWAPLSAWNILPDENTPLKDVPCCKICYEDIQDLANLPQKVTIECHHELDVCQSCLHQSISAQYSAKPWDHIDCPDCGNRMSSEEVLRHGDSAFVARYTVLWPSQPLDFTPNY